MRKYILPATAFSFFVCIPAVIFGQQAWEIYHTQNSGLPSNSIHDIRFRGDTAFIATGGGVAVTDLSAFTVYDTANSGLPSNQVYTVIPAGASKMAAGTAGGGIALYDNASWEIWNTQNSPLPDDHVKSIYHEDSLLWIGTTGGIARYNGNTWKIFNTGNSGLWSNNVNCIGKDENHLKYFGFLNGGMATIQYDTVVTLYVVQNSALQDNTITGIVFDSSGTGWMSFPSNGFQQCLPSPGLWFHTANSQIPTDGLEGIAIAPDQSLWFATQSTGVFRYDNGNVTVYHTGNSPLPANSINCLNADGQGRIWIGTEDDGLIVLDPALLGYEDTQNASAFRVFPNPCDGNFRVSSGTEKPQHIWITDIAGKIIRETDAGPDTRVFIGTPGIYFLHNGRDRAVKIVVK